MIHRTAFTIDRPDCEIDILVQVRPKAAGHASQTALAAAGRLTDILRADYAEAIEGEL